MHVIDSLDSERHSCIKFGVDFAEIIFCFLSWNVFLWFCQHIGCADAGIYDVDDLFQAGVIPLKYWTKEYKQKKTFAVTWNKNGNSDVIMIDKKWFELLRNLNSKEKFNSEEKEFLDYCVEERILV